jgi:hypothetical protein
MILHQLLFSPGLLSLDHLCLEPRRLAAVPAAKGPRFAARFALRPNLAQSPIVLGKSNGDMGYTYYNVIVCMTAKKQQDNYKLYIHVQF